MVRRKLAVRTKIKKRVRREVRRRVRVEPARVQHRAHGSQRAVLRITAAMTEGVGRKQERAKRSGMSARARGAPVAKPCAQARMWSQSGAVSKRARAKPTTLVQPAQRATPLQVQSGANRHAQAVSAATAEWAPRRAMLAMAETAK